MIDHNGKSYGWAFITFMNLGTAVAVWKFFDVLPTFPHPRVLAIVLVATVVVDLISTISVTRRCLLPSPVGTKEEDLTDLEERMLAQNLRKGKNMALITPGREERTFFILGRDEYMGSH